jgi:uncharacterized protein (TIGR03085 family)
MGRRLPGVRRPGVDEGTIRRVTQFARTERTALADLMASVGPDAPTLCEGWTTRDLAAHLVVRASRPDAAAGIFIRPLAAHTKRVQDRVAALAWPELVARVRRRPWWAVVSEEPINLVEYFVHHEDVRRAQDGWHPRELPGALHAALWSRLRLQAKLVLRKTPATVTVTAPGLGSITAGRGAGNGDGADEVDLVGPPQELLLFLMGRQSRALVELAGPEAITARMRIAHYGI